jgi:hypothetical protein
MRAIFGDKAVEAENCSTCPTSSSCHGAGRGEGRADVSTKQKVFPRRQSAGVMTVMPQHVEHSHASSPYDGGSAKGSADVNATQLVSSTTQHRGSVVGAPRPPQATPKYDNDHFGSLRAGIVTLTTDSRGGSGSDRSVHTLCGTLGTRLLVPDSEFVGPDCSVGTGGKTMAAGMEGIVDECVR